MKRGLKLFLVGDKQMPLVHVRTQAPMKRGLKHIGHHAYQHDDHVRTQAPMKRGLKPLTSLPQRAIDLGSEPRPR